MHEALEELRDGLTEVVEALEQYISHDSSFGVATANWSFPCISRPELVEEVQSIIDYIEDHDTDDLDDVNEQRVNDYVERLHHLSSQTIPNMEGNASAAVSAFQLTIEGLRNALLPLDEDGVAQSQKRLRLLRRQVRGMEATVNGLDPRTARLVDMVERIERAYEAADRLPADLESLSEARKEAGSLLQEVAASHERVSEIRTNGERIESVLKRKRQ